jgi:hypothetical protein
VSFKSKENKGLFMKTQLQILSTATLLALATSPYAQTMCVFDPLGTQGDAYFFMKDYAVAAKQWGADITLKAYTDDQRANDDFKDKKCDSLTTIGTRARQFNSFTGSLDSVGGMPSEAVAKTAIILMANPKLAAEMVNDNNEIVGVSSVGPVYPMTNDRNINNMAKMAGKTFGALSFDKPQMLISEKLDCVTVPVTIATVANKFNSGQVQIIALPAYAFKALDLAKGMGSKGAIVRFNVAYITTQIVIHQDKFPTGFGQKSRTWISGQLSNQLKTVQKVENSIDARYWNELPANDKLGYEKLFRQVRLDITKEGIYNKRMMGILKKIRCQQNPTSFECPMQGE